MLISLIKKLLPSHNAQPFKAPFDAASATPLTAHIEYKDANAYVHIVSGEHTLMQISIPKSIPTHQHGLFRDCILSEESVKRNIAIGASEHAPMIASHTQFVHDFEGYTVVEFFHASEPTTIIKKLINPSFEEQALALVTLNA